MIGCSYVLRRHAYERKREMRGFFPKLSMRYYGPFQITERINDGSFRLRLPDTWKIHNAFHVSLLKPFKGDVPDEQPEVEENEEILVPEQILHIRIRKRKFSKAASRVRQNVSALPDATAAEDALETDESKETVVETHEGLGGERLHDSPERDEAENDPFGLNALLSKPSKRDERISKRKEEEAATRKVQEEEARLLRERREALMLCLEIAAGRYRVKWAQTIIDILVKHAFDNISKFTSKQRRAIENLWSSVKEQQIRRKQGKSATGKLDVTGFERLQSQYSQAKISIRHSVGADGDRGAEQWLG
ncbi:hypothetical protein L7F22_065595 [Adiantum nelumboides]|nr:hypothetical protein [Adiantum nelumboides]